MIETHPTLAQQEFIAKEMLHRRNVRILRIMLLVLLLALWELCARLGIINDKHGEGWHNLSPYRRHSYGNTGKLCSRRRGRSCDRDSVMVQPQCIRGFRALSRHAQQPS